MAALPRSFSLAVFRAHIENGLTVAIGVGLTGLITGWGLGFDAAIAAGSGAVCVSISDRTDPLRQKIWIMGMAFLCTVFFTALSDFARFSTPAFVASFECDRHTSAAPLQSPSLSLRRLAVTFSEREYHSGRGLFLFAAAVSTCLAVSQSPR